MQTENAEPEVVTSAPPLDSIPPHADLEATWTGDDGDGKPATSPRDRFEAAIAAADRIAWRHDDECPHRYCGGDVEECDPCDAGDSAPCTCSGRAVLELIGAARARVNEQSALLVAAEERAGVAEREARIHREAHRGALAGLEEAKQKLARAEAAELLYEEALETLAALALRGDAADEGRFREARVKSHAAGVDIRLADLSYIQIRGSLRDGAEARAQVADLESKLAVAADCIARGLDAVTIDDLLAALERRVVALRDVPAAPVVVARDDGGDHPG